jgi:hypothetical protein
MIETLPADPLKVLEQDRLSILVTRDSQELFRSYVGGVRPLLELVDWFPSGLRGATVVDRVVGACAARFFSHLRVERVIGLTGSLPASRILHAEAIPFEFHWTVTDIRGRDNSCSCPFEELSCTTKDPVALIATIRERLRTQS